MRKMAIVGCLILATNLLSCGTETVQCRQKFEQDAVISDERVIITGRIGFSHLTQVPILPSDTQVLEFHNSPGGSVLATKRLVRRFTSVRITGEYCNSACVMALTEFDNVCIEPSVQHISFHTISTIWDPKIGDYCLKWVNGYNTLAYVKSLRPGLQERVWELPAGELLIPITLDEFLEHYPEKLCKS